MSSFASLAAQRNRRLGSKPAFTEQPIPTASDYGNVVVPEQTPPEIREAVAQAFEATPEVEMAPAAAPGEDEPEQADEGELLRGLTEDLEVRRTEGRGRGVWVKKDRQSAIKPGTTLLSLTPHAAVLSSHLLPIRCSTTFLEPGELAPPPTSPSPAAQPKVFACMACQTVKYSSKEAQRADWAAHRPECEALRSFRSAPPAPVPPSSEDGNFDPLHPDFKSKGVPGVPGEAVRALARLVWGKEKHDAAWWKEVEDMQSHRSSLSPNTSQSHAQLALLLSRYLSPSASSPVDLASLGLPSPAALLDLIAKFTTNSFSLTSPDLSNIGVAICPTVALINHSFTPNAVVVFPHGGSKMEVVAIKEIPPGSEVLTSYVDLAIPHEEQRKDLQERYFFDVGPSPVPREDDPRERILPGVDREKAEEVRRKAARALKKAEKLEFSKPAAALAALHPHLEPLRAHLPPSSHPSIPLHRLYLTLLISLSSSSAARTSSPSAAYTEAARIGLLVLAGMESVYPAGHPARGVVAAEVGKLLLVADQGEGEEKAMERLRMGREMHIRALGELRVGFGRTGGLLGKDVERRLGEVEREMQMRWAGGQ